MKVELVGTTKPDSLVLKNLPALVGQDAEAHALSEESPQGGYRCLIARLAITWRFGTSAQEAAPSSMAFG